MNKYRISKYNPLLRKNGIYINVEWTSYNDIGKIFNNKVFTKDEYLSYEDKYCYTVLLILEYFHINEITLNKLELYFSNSKLKKLLTSKGIDFTLEDEALINSLFEGQVVNILDLNRYLKLILRDCFWCEFKNDNAVRIECGQDFYIYIYCNNISEKIINMCEKKGIYIEYIS